MVLALVDSCLETIVDNIDMYNLAFKTTKDEAMKRKLEFLQRRYSFDILTKLSTRSDSLEEYVDLLVNKYLKVLDTAWLRNCSWEKVTSKIAEIGSNVEKIIFQDVYFEEFSEEAPWDDTICYLPNLKRFIFHDDCHDSILKNVAIFCPNIEEIDFQNSAVTFEAVKNLCKNENGKALCTKLKKLFIAGSNIKEDGVKYFLKNLPSLEIIDYPDLPLVLYSLHKNDLLSLDKVEPYNIATLNLINCTLMPQFLDLLKVCLSVCPYLKSLNCGLINDKLNFFPNLPYLEHLTVENVSDSEINVNNLLISKGRKLTSLTIVNCAVSISVLAENCPSVKNLILIRVHFLLDDSKPVFNMLSSCTFENISISTSAKAISLLLSSSAKLESLSFIKCNSSSSEIKAHILKYCELYPVKKISFCGSLIDKEYIKDLLLNCQTLNYLNIDGCFNSDDEDELVKFAEILCNKPEIDISDHLDISDYEEYLNVNYELDDYELDYDYDYEGYDDYDDYDYEYEDDSDER